jgi:hypothetical protein
VTCPASSALTSPAVADFRPLKGLRFEIDRDDFRQNPLSRESSLAVAALERVDVRWNAPADVIASGLKLVMTVLTFHRIMVGILVAGLVGNLGHLFVKQRSKIHSIKRKSAHCIR